MIIITGAAGFIGSVLTKELNNLGFDNLLLVDRLRSGSKWKNLVKLKYQQFVHADELFSGKYDEFLLDTKVIFHLGACSSTVETNVDYLMKNNVHYSQELCKIAIRNDIPFIYASSAATYGDGSQGYDDDHSRINSLRPLNPYGYSKQVFDQWMLKADERPKHWYGLKFFNVYGPNEYHKADMTSVVFKAYEQIRTTGQVKLFKSYLDEYTHGEQLRDFVYVKDAAKGMIALLNNRNEADSGIYNMGAGKARTFNDLVLATFKALNAKPNVEYIDMPLEIRNQYQYFTEANMHKFLKAVPKFKFKTLEEGVEDYVQSHLSQFVNEDRYY